MAGGEPAGKRLRQGEKNLKLLQDGGVGGWEVGVRCRQIPEAQADQQPGGLGLPDKIENSRKIAGNGWVGIVLAEAVQGDVDLAQGRAGQQKSLPLGEQGAVGGQVDLEAMLLAEGEKIVKLRVQEGFAQHMQGKMVGVPLDLAEDGAEILGAHEGFCPVAPVAEAAGKIAAVGDFEVYFFEFFQSGSIKNFDVAMFAFGTAEHGVNFFKGHAPALFGDGLGEVLFTFGAKPTVAFGGNKKFHFFHLSARGNGIIAICGFAAMVYSCLAT